ncbi:MAG TPA: zinc-binding alcohol dehydrogenase family protein [Rhodocyclaceae bacterium]|nr:zinc-binding alcohol dehydrogenase family protein [Rhodocyclaceae bacterium]
MNIQLAQGLLTMKAVAYKKSLPITDIESLQDVTLADPIAAGRDLLVEVKAISVNPVDTKVRRNTAPEGDAWKILGWDATGIVRAVGPAVRNFKPGDRVWYAGALTRAGSNSELQLVDERIVGRMPMSIDFAAAAALPLTGLTAWEMLFDRFGITPGESGKSLLIVGAAGGVGSIMVQLAKQLTGLTVIGTASRPQSREWLRELGADHVIDHTQVFAPQLQALGIAAPHYVVSLTHTDEHFAQIVDAIAPQGKFGLIDDPEPINVMLLKRKSVSLHWELMFTRALFETPDMDAQGRILAGLAELVDAGRIRTTLNERFGTINAANLRRAHALLESGQSRGKIVLEGF